MIAASTSASLCGKSSPARAIPVLPILPILWLLLMPVPASSQELGRFFFTPQQRDTLDRQRATNVQAPTPVVVEDRITVNGQVTRSSGPGTTWINGQPRESRQPVTDPIAVSLPQGQGEPPVSLKVGETLDRAKGETRDVLEDGSIAVSRQGRR